MPIHERGYRHWEGTLRGRLWRSFAIARSGTELALRKRSLISLVLLCITPSFLFAVALFVVSRDPQNIAKIGKLLGEGTSWARFVGKDLSPAHLWALLYSRFLMIQLISVAVIVTSVGPELISKDLRAGALQVYYSRPMTRRDYILGKLMIVAVFVGLITLVPAVLLYLVGVVLSKEFAVVGQTFHVLLGIVGAYLVIAFVAGVLVLTISSLSRRSAHVGILWALLMVLPEVAYWLVKATYVGVTGSASSPKNWSHLLSIRANVVQLIAKIFGLKDVYAFDWFASFFVLTVLMVAALGLLFRRVQTLEGEH